MEVPHDRTHTHTHTLTAKAGMGNERELYDNQSLRNSPSLTAAQHAAHDTGHHPVRSSAFSVRIGRVHPAGG